jgi:SAM-dependent methyltransferase
VNIVGRALLAASRVADRAARGLMYAAMGTMRLADLRGNVAESWGDFYTGEADIASGFMWWELEVVERFVKPASRVLLIGSGTGRDALAFAALGCRVTGVEPSAKAIAIARSELARRSVTAEFVHGFFEEAPVDGPFDVVVFSWFSYSYTPVRARRVEALKKAKRLLAPGGCIVVSCVVNPAPPQARLVAVQRIVGRMLGSDWVLEPGDNVRPFRPDRHVITYEHMFRPGELEHEAAAAGLHISWRNREDWVYVLANDRP